MAVNLVVTTADKRLGQKSAETCRTPSQHSDPRTMNSMIDVKVPALATEVHPASVSINVLKHPGLRFLV